MYHSRLTAWCFVVLAQLLLGGGLAAGFAMTNRLLGGGRGRAGAQEPGGSGTRAGSARAGKAPQVRRC